MCFLVMRSSQPTWKSGKTWKKDLTVASGGKIREFEKIEFDWPKRENCQSVIVSFSNIMFTQANGGERMGVREKEGHCMPVL